MTQDESLPTSATSDKRVSKLEPPIDELPSAKKSKSKRSEPYEPKDKPSQKGIVLLAIGVALLLAWLAPKPWLPGDGHIELLSGEKVVLRAPVKLGSAKPLSFGGSLEGQRLRLSLPRGVPIGVPVDARVGWVSKGSMETLGKIQISLVLSDGTKELIPVFRTEGKEILARRRPPKKAWVLLGLLGLVVILWVTEAIPLYLTSLLIPIFIVITGAGKASGALAPFFHPIIALFFGGFLMAEAMRRVGLDRVAAIAIVGRLGSSPKKLFFAMLGVAAFLSMWMSNTAATAVLVPIAMAVSAPLNNLNYRKTLVLGIAYAATIGGVGSAIGTPANPLAIEFLGSYVGREVKFCRMVCFWVAYGRGFSACDGCVFVGIKSLPGES